MNILKQFFIKNTPEAALAGALLAAATGYFTQALTPKDAILAAVSALVAFGFAEAGKDGRQSQNVTAPEKTPETINK